MKILKKPEKTHFLVGFFKVGFFGFFRVGFFGLGFLLPTLIKDDIKLVILFM